VYPVSNSDIHSTRESADAFARPDRVACVFVSGEEGKELCS
jgi:hypothetical protein